MKEGGVSLTVSMESGQLDTAIKVSEYTLNAAIYCRSEGTLYCTVYTVMKPGEFSFPVLTVIPAKVTVL